MRVAFFNVYKLGSAEAQAAECLCVAGKRIGVEVIPCYNSAEVEECKPDFVIVNSRTQAKLTGYFTYACLNEPSTVYFRDPKLLQYFYTFDGYTSLSDNLADFANQTLYGIGRSETISDYFNTALQQTTDICDVASIIKSGNEKISYFGTNWDGRRIDFFRTFGRWDKAAIYGPESRWADYKMPSYKGSTPFDGASVQNVYRKNAIGLNFLGDHHLREDVISNRVFEIASVGGLVISCDMPWLRKHFGDSIYYFDQERSNKQMFEEITAIHAHIAAHPDEAAAKASKARAIFEQKFTMEVLLKKLVEAHKQRMASIMSQSHDRAPLVSVLIKSDGSRIDALQRAIRSVANQDSGRTEIILVKTKPFDFKFTAPNTTLETVDGQSLWDGLRLVKGDYFAVLRDIDEWFPQHLRRMLEFSKAGHFVHCTLVTEHETPAPETEWVKNNEMRGVSYNLELKDKDIMSCLDLIHPSGYLAPRSVLDERLLKTPPALKNEHRALLMDVLGRTTPIQNFAATVLTRARDNVPEEKMNALEDTRFMLRHWRSKDMLWDTIVSTGYRARAFRYETDRTIENGIIVDRLRDSRFNRARLKPMPVPYLKQHSIFQMGFKLENDATLSATIDANEQMRGVAAFFVFPIALDDITPTEYVLALDAEVAAGQIGVHLVQNENTLERYSVARSLAAGNSYRLEIPVYYRPEISGLAIDVQPGTKARIKSITAYREE